MAAFDPSMLGNLGNQPQVRSLLQMLGWQDPNAGGGGGGAAIGGDGGGAPVGGDGGGGGGASGGGSSNSAPYYGNSTNSAPYYGGGSEHNYYSDISTQPGMSDYYDPITHQTKISDAATAAEQGGTTLAGLRAGFFPTYLTDNVQGYRIPSDQGGFFTAEDLFRDSNRGAVPQIGSFMQGSPSTNNWRLLGMGPGWIMRNGELIDTNSSGARWGGPRGWTPSGGNSGEQSMPAIGTALGAGGSQGVPNLLQSGLGQPASWGWPGADQWFGSGGPMAMQT